MNPSGWQSGIASCSRQTSHASREPALKPGFNLATGFSDTFVSALSRPPCGSNPPPSRPTCWSADSKTRNLASLIKSVSRLGTPNELAIEGLTELHSA
jgi:hypothetical protein